MSVGPLPTLAAEIAGHGIAGGNVHCAINLISPAMRAPHRICNAGLDGAGSLQELLSVECECDAVRMPSNNFRPTSASSALSDAVTADCVTLRPAAAAETLPVSAVAMKWRT